MRKSKSAAGQNPLMHIALDWRHSHLHNRKIYLMAYHGVI
jgi:hypothetical protein